jgi:hypothetical protein
MTVIINPIVQQQTIAINSFGVGLNGLPNGATNSLMELKYLFEGFPSPGAGFQYGDVCAFTYTSDSNNSYSADLVSVSTNETVYASKNLFVFVSYENGNLIVMQKGFIDFEDTTSSSLDSWGEGDTLYLKDEKMAITPPQTSGHFVKSIGFCMPNIENKKRIWFEPDSTYFTIS